jgi:hypothetical protein
MATIPTDQAQLALLTHLKESRTRRLAHVTACLADPLFRATMAPNDVAMVQSHQAALEKIIVLIERQRADTQALVKALEQAHPPVRKPVSRFHRYLVWRWGR